MDPLQVYQNEKQLETSSAPATHIIQRAVWLFCRFNSGVTRHFSAVTHHFIGWKVGGFRGLFETTTLEHYRTSNFWK